jgi:hypothetical protein
LAARAGGATGRPRDAGDLLAAQAHADPALAKWSARNRRTSGRPCIGPRSAKGTVNTDTAWSATASRRA